MKLKALQWLAEWWIRRRNAKVRSQIRTHQKIMRSGLDQENNRLIGLLEGTDLRIDPAEFRRIMPARYCASALMLLRQLCFANNYSVLLVEVSKHVAGESTSADIPLPHVLRSRLAELGVKISAASRGRFVISVVERYWRGLRTLRHLLKIRPENSPDAREIHDAHVLVKIRAGAIGSLSDHSRADFASWYRRHARLTGKDKIVAELPDAGEVQRINPRAVITPDHLPALSSASRTDFVRDAVRILAWTTWGLVWGRWPSAFLLSDALELSYFRHLPVGCAARSYVFDTGHALVRPLWTYAAEANGSEVIAVFYSANFVTFTTRQDASPARAPALTLMTWPRIICPDEQSGRALVSYGHAPESIDVSDGYIDYIDNGAAPPAIKGPTLLVFDVAPYRTHLKAVRGFHNAYYTYEQWLQFMDGIIAEGRRGGWTVALKPKRGAFLQHDRRYDRYLLTLERSGDVVFIDPGMTPSRAVRIADAVVSMPFTSPALAAIAEGKPAIYYDPGGRLRHCTGIAHGLPLLSDASALKMWLRKVVPQNMGISA